MKKFLYLALCLLLTAALSLCFVACGDDEEPTDSSTQSAGSKDQTTGSTDTTASSVTTGSSDTTDSSVTTDSSEDNGTTDSSKDDDKTTDSSNTTESSDTTASSDTVDSSTQNPPVDVHKHTYSDVYSYDADMHFYRATCEHTEEVTGIEAHSYDENLVCKCGRVKSVIEDVIETMLESKDAIISGYSEQANNNIEFSSVSTNKVTYIFYEDYVYVKEDNDYLNEYYYSVDESGKLVGIFVQNGTNVNVDDQASEDSLAGVKYNFGCFGDYETYVCGAESLIEYFYKYGIEILGTVEATNEGNTYSFTYDFCIIDEWMDYYYSVNVSFTVDEATGSLASTNITVDRYSKESYTVAEDGSYVLNEDAAANYTTTFTVTQSTQANEAVENPYAPDKVLLDSIRVTDKEDNNIEEITIKVRADETIKIFLKDIVPETAMLQLCNIEIVVEDEADGTEQSINPFYNSYDNSYSFLVKNAGTYKLLVYIDDITFETTVEVLPKVPYSISSQVYDVALGEFDKTAKVEVYAGSPLYFMSYVDSGYDGAYTASIVEGAENATLTQGEIGGKTASVFNSTTVGTYVIEIASTANTSLTAQLTVNVVEAPKTEDLLVGEYFVNGEDGNALLKVTFDSDNSTMSVIFNGSYGEEEAVYSYTVTDGVISLEYADGEEIVDGIYVNEQFQLVMSVYEEEYVLEQVIIVLELVSSGTLSVEDIAGQGANSYEYQFELYSNGEYVFYKNYAVTKEVSLTVKNGVYTFKYADIDAQALVKTSGDASTPAGEYTIEGVVNVTIALDKTPTAVKEPTYGTIEVDHISSGYVDYDFTYAYEIIDGAFVIYKYDEVTDEVTLVDLGGEYIFKYPGVYQAQTLQKIEGDESILTGKYKVEMMLGPTPYLIAYVTVTPGAKGPENPAASEESSGTLVLEDGNDTGLSGTYTYEIVDGAFVIYKNGVVTTDIIVTLNLDGTYSFQCEGIVPQALVKVDGEEGVLAGTYNVNDGTYVLTFTPDTNN